MRNHRTILAKATPEVAVADTGPQPAAPPAGRREARDAKGFQPSTFATRKAEAADRSPRPRRLVSLGRQVHRDPGVGESGRPRVQEYEGFVDLDDPHTVYARMPGSTELVPVTLRTGEPDRVSRLDPMPARPRFTTGRFPPGEPDRVDLGEELPW
jgi:hypothetical protein